MVRNRLTRFDVLALAAAVGVAILLAAPMAGNARQQGKAAVCLMNQRILSQAWLQYPEDHEGRLVGGSTYYSGSRRTPYRWVEQPLFRPTDNPAPPPDGRNDAVPAVGDYNRQYRLNGIVAGELFPYVENTAVYHCPGDRTCVTRPEPYAAYRSYTVSGLMNGEDFVQRTGWPGAITGYRTVGFPDGNKTLVCVERLEQVRRPDRKYVFVEEDVGAMAQAENLGSFVLMGNGSSTSWWDWPAGFHPESATFGFADGHAYLRTWRDVRTVSLITGQLPISQNQPANPDLEWMVRGYVSAEP